MQTILTKHASPALIVAMIALFVALSGISYAAATALPRNSVGALQLKANAVNSSKVLNHSLRSADFKPGQLPKGPTGAKGATGAPGPAGAAGAAGAAGSPGLSAIQIVSGAGQSGTGTHTDTVTCPAGKKAISGGWATAGIDSGSDLSITYAAIQDDGISYRVDGTLTSGTDSWNLNGRLLCATVAS